MDYVKMTLKRNDGEFPPKSKRPFKRDSRDESLTFKKVSTFTVGRLAVMLACFAFLASYVYSIWVYGIIIALTTGWLTSSVLAWMTANATLSLFNLLHGIQES